MFKITKEQSSFLLSETDGTVMTNTYLTIQILWIKWTKITSQITQI